MQEKVRSQAECEGLLQGYAVRYNGTIISLIVEMKEQATELQQIRYVEEGYTLGKTLRDLFLECFPLHQRERSLEEVK